MILAGMLISAERQGGKKAKTVRTVYGAPELKIVDKTLTGYQPKSVELSPDGRKLYVANFGKPDKDSIREFDAANLEHTRTFKFDGNAVEMAFSPDGKYLYASNFRTHRIEVIDLALGKVVDEIKSKMHPKTIVVSGDGGTLYVANWGSDTVSVIDATRREVVRTIHTGSRPRGMVLTGDGRLIVAGFKSNRIYEYDVNDNYKKIRKTDVCSLPRHLVLSPDEKILYVTCSGNWVLHWFDVETMEKTGVARTGRNPRSLAMTDDGRWLVVADFGSDSVTLIDTQNATHRSTPLEKADGIVGIAVASGPDLKIYATSWWNQHLFVLEPTRRCANFRTVLTKKGDRVDCYPMRCRNAVCLTQCETTADCAGARKITKINEEGWPLRCNSHRKCVPLPPNEVPVKQ